MQYIKNLFLKFTIVAKKAILLVIALLTVGLRVVYANPLAFIDDAADLLQTIVIALGAGLAIWGGINLMEGYGSDNPGSKSQGIKQLMAGAGIILIGVMLIPQIPSLFA